MPLRFGTQGRSVVGGKIKWSNDPIAKLGNVKNAIKNRIIRKGMVAGTRVLKQLLKKAPTPKRTGAMRTAMWEKIYRPKKEAKMVGVVGPRSKFERILGVRTRGKHKGEPIKHKPGKIKHLVDRGFRTRGGGRFAGLRFMELAFRKGWGHSKTEMFRVIEEEVQKELAKR